MIRCSLCGDPVPEDKRTPYCREACRRHAAYLAYLERMAYLKQAAEQREERERA